MNLHQHFYGLCALTGIYTISQVSIHSLYKSAVAKRTTTLRMHSMAIWQYPPIVALFFLALWPIPDTARTVMAGRRAGKSYVV
jgi:hypothetical protein